MTDNVTLCANFYLSKFYYFLRLFTSIRPKSFRKNNSYVIYLITWDVPLNYRMSADNKEKFYIVELSGRLVKFKAFQVERKLTSLRISRRNSCFCSEFSLVKFI